MEIWKEIKDTNGKLYVSSLGRVKSTLRNPEGVILKCTSDKKGYQRLRVTIDGEKRSYKLHRLVAEYFIDNPYNKPQVNHINGDKFDNRASNLEWVTNKENCQHAVDNGLWESQFRAIRRRNEQRETDIIAYELLTGKTLRFESIHKAEVYCGTKHITDVLKGKRSQAKGYKFYVVAKGGGLECQVH